MKFKVDDYIIYDNVYKGKIISVIQSKTLPLPYFNIKLENGNYINCYSFEIVHDIIKQNMKLI
jgi:hypothetical protein